MYYQIKPYLRLLSSITKKEKDELIDLGLGYIDSGRYEDENGVLVYNTLRRILPEDIIMINELPLY